MEFLGINSGFQFEKTSIFLNKVYRMLYVRTKKINKKRNQEPHSVIPDTHKDWIPGEENH